MRTVALCLGIIWLAGAGWALDAGQKAPSLKSAKWYGDGRAPRLGDGQHVFVVEFWATWCGPCRATIPNLNRLAEQYRDAGLVVVGATADEPAKVEEFLRKYPMNYHVACVDEGVQADYLAGIGSIPHAFVVNRAGQVLWEGNPLGGGLEETVAKALGPVSPPAVAADLPPPPPPAERKIEPSPKAVTETRETAAARASEEAPATGNDKVATKDKNETGEPGEKKVAPIVRFFRGFGQRKGEGESVAAAPEARRPEPEAATGERSDRRARNEAAKAEAELARASEAAAERRGDAAAVAKIEPPPPSAARARPTEPAASPEQAEQRRQLDLSLRKLDEVLREQPGDFHAYRTKAEVLTNFGLLEAVPGVYAAWETGCSGNSTGLAALAIDLCDQRQLQLRNPRQALRCAARAMQLSNRGEPLAVEAMVRAYGELGMLENALETLSQAKKTGVWDGRLEMVWDHYAEIANLRGRLQRR